MVGAGPTGLLTAVGLARRGVDVEVVDARTRPDPTTRALSVWGRAADVLVQHGIDADLLERLSVPVRRLVYFDGPAHLATFTLPATAPCRTLPQQRTEELLAQRLAELGVHVAWGTEVVDVEQDEDGVSLEVEGPQGRARTRSRYVVAADGARSTVRRRLGVGFDGETMERRFAVVDARLARGELDVDACQFHQSRTGPLVVVPIGDGVFRFLCSNPESGPDGVGEVVRSRGLDVELGEVVSSAVFTVHAREAARYRVDRVFLVGDAAHIHSPAGGQGMNNGLQDAHNLSWKLASVIHGAPSRLLDTYEQERRPATARIMADTTRQMRWWMLATRRGILARNLAFRLAAVTGAAARWYAPVMAGYRTLYPVGVPGRGPLRCRGARAVGRLWSAPLVDGWVVATREPALVESVLRTAASQVRVVTAPDECRRGGVSLVRPDGHVQWHGHRGDVEGLRDALRWWGLVGRDEDEVASVRGRRLHA